MDQRGRLICLLYQLAGAAGLTQNLDSFGINGDFWRVTNNAQINILIVSWFVLRTPKENLKFLHINLPCFKKFLQNCFLWNNHVVVPSGDKLKPAKIWKLGLFIAETIWLSHSSLWPFVWCANQIFLLKIIGVMLSCITPLLAQSIHFIVALNIHSYLYIVLFYLVQSS